MLIEEGFEVGKKTTMLIFNNFSNKHLYHVVSIDASDKMLKYALKERWNRRKERNFDNWSE